MITDIPTPQEFERSSLNFMHLAWSIASSLLDELDCADLPSWDDDGSAGSAYLTEAQPELGNALALVLQAQEMSLKGRIAAISPYLIIARDPRDWPKRCETNDVSFAEFRSADAADLIRIHDTVSPARMPREFADLFIRSAVDATLWSIPFPPATAFSLRRSFATSYRRCTTSIAGCIGPPRGSDTYPAPLFQSSSRTTSPMVPS